jgi:hypothetical protein
MSNAIINPIGKGFVPDYQEITCTISSLAVTAGDILQIKPNGNSDTRATLAQTPVLSSTAAASFFGVAVEDRTTSDTTVRVCIRGRVQAHIFESSPISHAAPMLVCSYHDTTGGVPDDALTNPVDMNIDGDGAVTAKVIAMYNDVAAATGSSVAWVLFNGIEGFGQASAPLA